MIGALLGRTFAANRVRIIGCTIALLVWGAVMPLVYASFGRQYGSFIRNNPLLEQFTQFGGGDMFSLSGAMALGFVHPFAITVMGIIAVGMPILAIVGERQRGTLEVLLSRPVSRRALIVVVVVVGITALALLLAAQLVSNVVGAYVAGVQDELSVRRLPLVWAMGLLLFGAIMAIALAASVSFDRVMPALGVTLLIVLVSYLFEVIGSLWPEMRGLGDLSLFHYVRTKELLEGTFRPTDALLIGGVMAAALAWAWFVFPRRDIAAPS
ncbi:MAG: ABC transporter permease subunit [Chloroflexi bacterium]|nr:ABC transporter permease subunit [Chloroflexota bacterium]